MMNAREANARNSLVGSRIGKFDVIAEIGTGGMASVYLARATGTGGFNRLVAIKVMHPHLSQEDSFVEMFLDEARVAATIQHPNVASIIDVGIEEGLIFLVMDYVEGDSFSNVEKMAVNLRRRIPLGITLRVALDALAGLHCAHELTDHAGNPLRIIHRDVSPQNIVVGVDGVARIVDFGIAKAESRITNTQVGLIKGKLNFMAPEQIRGGALDRRVDIFGMGVTLWEAVTLRRLFAGDNEFDTARRILAGEYPSLLDYDPKLPPILDAICRRALHPDPDQRFATCAEFAETIELELRNHIAGAREVSGFISGVAAQKIERERRALRDAAALGAEHDDDLDEPSFMSSTLVDATIGPTPAAISKVLPSSAMPRPQAKDDAPTVRKGSFRAPTMSMPTRGAVAPTPRQATPAERDREVGGSTRPLRVSAPSQPPRPTAGTREEYDDEGATSPFQTMQVAEQARALRGIRPVAPQPQPQNDLDEDTSGGDESTGESRTVFQPVYGTKPIRPGAEDIAKTVPAPRFSQPAPMTPPMPQGAPVERSMAIDLVQRRQALGDAPPQNDLFAQPPQSTLPVSPPGMPPQSTQPMPPSGLPQPPVYGVGPMSHHTPQQPWQFGAVPGAAPPPSMAPLQPPPPTGLPAYVYVLASLVLLGAALAVLAYVLRMRG